MSDRHAVRAMIDALVEGRGQTHWATPGSAPWSTLLVPTEGMPGSPILLKLSDDEVVATVGVGSLLFLAAEDMDEVGRSLAIIGAILDVGATEFGVLDDSGVFKTEVVVEGPFGSYDLPRGDAMFIRTLEPWAPRAQPPQQ